MEQNKTKKVSLIAGVLIFAIGLVLILCNKSITGEGVIVLAGVLFLLTGIVNVILYSTHKSEPGEKQIPTYSVFLGWLMSIAAIILGVCMLIFTKTFGTMIPVIFGILIFFGAVVLSLTMLRGVRKVLKVPGWTWIFPIAMVGLGVATILQEANANDPLIMILTGVSMILFGLGAGVVGILVSGATKGVKRQIEESAATKTEKKEKPEAKS